MDVSLATRSTLSNAKNANNVKNVRGGLECKEVEFEEHTKKPKVTTKETEQAVELLGTVLEPQENVGQGRFAAIAGLRKIIDSNIFRRRT